LLNHENGGRGEIPIASLIAEQCQSSGPLSCFCVLFVGPISFPSGDSHTIAIFRPFSIAFANTVAEEVTDAVQNNVKLDSIPDDIDEWHHGHERPQHILGESEKEPFHYHLFKFEREIRGSGFKPTGKNFGGLDDTYRG
jgi:hypothetical protein